MHRRKLLKLGAASGIGLAFGPRPLWSQPYTAAPPGLRAFSIFQGVDSLTGEARSLAVGGAYDQAGEASVPFSASICKTTEEFKKATDTSVSASVSVAGIGGVSGKAHWFNSLEINKYSTTIVCRVQHVQGSQAYTNAALLDAAKNLDVTTADGQAQFVRIFGDSFVSSVVKGGEYIAVYIFEAETMKEKEDFEVSLSANGVYKALSGGVDMQKTIHQTVETSSQRTVFEQFISGFIDPPPLPSADDIVTFGRHFPSLALTSPNILKFTTQGYETLPDFANAKSVNAFNVVVAARTYFQGGSFSDGLLTKLDRIDASRNAATAISRVYDRYSYKGDAKLHQNLAQLTKDKTAIAAQVDQFNQNAARAFTEPSLPSLAFGIPQLRCRMVESQQYGGGQNLRVDQDSTLLDVRRFFENGQRISSVKLCYNFDAGTPAQSAGVIALDVTFESFSGAATHRVGVNDGEMHKPYQYPFQETWTAPLTLDGDQWISKVTFEHRSSAIQAIRIESSDGRAIATPSIDNTNGYTRPLYPTDLKTDTWTPPPGAILAGFRSLRRPGADLRGLVLIAAQLQEAAWRPA